MPQHGCLTHAGELTLVQRVEVVGVAATAAVEEQLTAATLNVVVISFL